MRSQAYDAKKEITNLDWLVYVLFSSASDPKDAQSATLPSPMDRLLHYPWPKKPLPHFQDYIITVSGYTGAARDALKKMIELMGGKFEGNMTKGKTTHVVSATYTGNKVQHANVWNIPVINHTWIEDCFIGWAPRTPALQCYTNYDNVGGEGFTYASLVGSTTISPNIVSEWAARQEVQAEKATALEALQSSISVDADVHRLRTDEVEEATQPTPDPPTQPIPSSSRSLRDPSPSTTETLKDSSDPVQTAKLAVHHQGSDKASASTTKLSSNVSVDIPAPSAIRRDAIALQILDHIDEPEPSENPEERQREERAIEAALIDKPRLPLKRKSPPSTSTPNTPQPRLRVFQDPSSSSTVSRDDTLVAAVSKPQPAKRKKSSISHFESTQWDPGFIVRSSSGRKAAENAAQKLHEIIMPDVLNFAEEQKGGGRKRLNELFGGREEEAGSAKKKAKRRSSVPGSSYKDNSRIHYAQETSNEEDDSDVEHVPDPETQRHHQAQNGRTTNKNVRVMEPPTPEVVSRAGKGRVDKLKQMNDPVTSPIPNAYSSTHGSAG